MDIISVFKSQPATIFYIVAIIGLLSTIFINQNTVVKEHGSSKLTLLLNNTFFTVNRWYTKQAWALVVTMLVVGLGVYVAIDVHPRSIIDLPLTPPALSISFLIGGLLTVWVGQVALRTSQISSFSTLRALQHSGLKAGFRTAWLRGSLPILFGIFFMVVMFTAIVWPNQLPLHWMHSRSMSDHLLAMALGVTIVTLIRNIITGTATNSLLDTLANQPEHQTQEGALILKTVRSSIFGSLWSAKWVQTLFLVITSLLLTGVMHRSLSALHITLWAFVIGALITLGVSLVVRKHNRYSLHQSLKYGLIITGLLLVVIMFWLSLVLLPSDVFWPFFLSFSTGVFGLYLIIGVAEYYSQATFTPLLKLVRALERNPQHSKNTVMMITISAGAWCVVFLLCISLILSLLGGILALPWALLGAAMLSMFIAVWCLLPYGGYIASFAAPVGRMPAEVRARANMLAKEADSTHTMSLIALGIISTVMHLVLVWNWLHLRGAAMSLEGMIAGILCGFILCGSLTVYLLQCSQSSSAAVRKDDLRADQNSNVRIPSIAILRSLAFSPIWILLILFCSLALVGILFGSAAILGMMICIILLSGAMFILLSLQTGMARQAFWSLKNKKQTPSVKRATEDAAMLKRTTHNYLEIIGLPMLSIVSTMVLLLWIVSWLIPLQGFAI